MDFLDTIDHELHKLRQLAIAFLILAWLTGFLRFYVRARILRNFSWDDWATLATLICWTCTCGIAFYLVEDFDRMYDADDKLNTKELQVVRLIRPARDAHTTDLVRSSFAPPPASTS